MRFFREGPTVDGGECEIPQTLRERGRLTGRTGEKSLAWARERNADSSKEIAGDPGFAALESQILEVLDSKEKIPFVGKEGKYYYNFWKDAEHPRGLWRRTTFAEYKKASPKWD